ncbi:MAG: hypothetical protein VW405_08640 [Rhodospirillaceae bacterium]
MSARAVWASDIRQHVEVPDVTLPRGERLVLLDVPGVVSLYALDGCLEVEVGGACTSVPYEDLAALVALARRSGWIEDVDA